MQIIYQENHTDHQPPYEIFNGEQTPHNEVAARVDRILTALRNAGYQPERVTSDLENNLVEEVHSPEYIQFLRERSSEIEGNNYAYPSVFRYRAGRESGNPLAQLGNYSFDMYTPILRNTFDVAWSSAAAAFQVAQLIQGREKVGYALCRPPGHHAEYDQMGGYCYFNNCAIAAQYLSQFGKVATLDVDFHHGNGTQHIFYENNRVFTTSIHAHPDWKFPYFSGYEEETGRGEGQGYNLNVALREGTTNQQYQIALETVLEQISNFRPQFLVVSLGLDTHETDPIGGFRLTTEYFTEMARTIASLDLPTVIVQEGGYNTELLGTNVVAFLHGWES
jgi:acetoin utilization deacetylase AcuC-like enzyme